MWLLSPDHGVLDMGVLIATTCGKCTSCHVEHMAFDILGQTALKTLTIQQLSVHTVLVNSARRVLIGWHYLPFTGRPVQNGSLTSPAATAGTRQGSVQAGVEPPCSCSTCEYHQKYRSQRWFFQCSPGKACLSFEFSLQSAPCVCCSCT